MSHSPSRRPLALVLALFALVAAGCAAPFTPFTDALVARARLRSNEVSSLQFYNSVEIRLTRHEEQSSGRLDERHRLVLSEGRSLEEIVIPARTPGVLVGGDDDWLTVSFEEGKTLTFEREPIDPVPDERVRAFATPPDEPRVAAAYVPSRSSYRLATDEQGRVSYAGQTWSVTPSSRLAVLEVRVETDDSSDESATTVKGRPLGP
jgi:hypothetical protein